ncbi:hypothetical protein [Paractinoplanes globisporus]|uniref:Uncharacterized protein n=1 Tax=Paractinoplanes globisporus TaxID=113565 RepID=A0ABW6WIA3_9ACTN|nr:hypothetical protein [Actinoplanes globisporus]
MSAHGIQAWQLSLIVTLLIVAIEPLVHLLLTRRPNLAISRWFRTTALALLLVLTVVVAVAALGPDLADKLSSVAAGAVAVVAFVLALRSYQSQDAPPSGTGAPDPPEAASPSTDQPPVAPPPATSAIDPAPEPPSAIAPAPSVSALSGPAPTGPALTGPAPTDAPPPDPAPGGPPPRPGGPNVPPAPRQPFLSVLVSRWLAGRKTPRR